MSGSIAGAAARSVEMRVERRDTYSTRLDQLGLSSRTVLSRAQVVVGSTLGIVSVAALLARPRAGLVAISAGVTLLYVLAMGYRLALFWYSVGAQSLVRVSDDEARALADDVLPAYTVLVPIYREPEVAEQLLAALGSLDYPAHLLEVLVLLEADDDDTARAVLVAEPDPHIRIVHVPDGSPKTKPRACNYGLEESRGELVTIYDAEDLPDPLQLRRAVAAFRRLGPRVACLQARLDFYNPHQNLITQWFTIDYGLWFAYLLPGLIRLRAPIPLGGTSNHIRREALEEVAGWDGHNVTEDADLGIRLARFGYRVMVLDSTTGEEANSDFVNWVRQRSRWYKGYFQTWLVHLRHPVQLYRELGPAGFAGFNLFIGGTPLVAALNPVVWALTLSWLIAGPGVVQTLYPSGVYLPALVCLVLGNIACVYMGLISTVLNRRPRLLGAALAMPAYWGMQSLAALKAAWQLLVAPSFWEKTVHGLSQPPTEDGSPGAHTGGRS